MTILQQIKRILMPSRRLVPAAYRAGRMDIDGTMILDEHSLPWIGRGVVYGHGELGNDQDAQQIALAGFNWVRIGLRWWGTWGGVIIDSEDDTQTSLVLRTYLTNLRNRFIQARLQGLKTILYVDSNCGQSPRPGDAKCMLGTSNPQTFWTEGGQDKLDEYEHVIRWVTRMLRGLIDFIEVAVEPNPITTIPTGNVEADVKAVQARLMDAVLEEDPAMVFIIGAAPSYQTGKIFGWFEPTWLGKYKIVYAANLLDNASTGSGVVGRIQKMTNTRALGAPICCEQVGTQLVNDPTDSFARAVLDELNDPTDGGGSISWTWWEWISPDPTPPNPYGSYGPLHGDSNQRTIVPQRMGTLQAAAAAPRLYA